MYNDDQIGRLNLWIEICKSASWWEPFAGIVFICDHPSVHSVDEGGFLHKDGGPALLCRDGWPVYALHGVRMKAEYVEIPAEKLTAEIVLKEPNAGVRRELLRKVGIERMLASLPHKTLDKRGDYEVISVELSPELKDARYLKMLNPSIGVWHLEGVPPEDNTVEKCLNRRNHNWFADAEILT